MDLALWQWSEVRSGVATLTQPVFDDAKHMVFIIAASLLILDKMLKLFDFVALQGGPVSVVFKMLANLLPEYASLAIPLGLMLGILLAFRRLATSSELDVMRAVGLSYTRLLRVPYLFTVVLAAVLFALFIFVESKADWVTINDGYPQFARMKP